VGAGAVVTTVNVTAEHIRDGIAADALQCPVAFALKSIFPYAERVTVGANLLMVKHYRSMFQTFYVMPQSVHDFILAFDGLTPGTVEPFSFQLEKEI
jgi:hypothetical protein